MPKEIIVPAAAAAGGIAGFFLRRWELSSAFEPETGLPIPMAPATLALIGLSAVMAAVLLVLCLGKHSVFPGGYDQAFQARGSTAYVLAMTLAAFLFLAAGFLTVLELPNAYTAEVDRLAAMRLGGVPLLAVLPMALLAVLAILACPCVLTTARNNYRGEGKGKLSLPLLVPAFMGCVWLITAYQKRAADPIQIDYVYELFAIVFALLGLYYMAGFSFERAKVVRAAWTSAMGVYFTLVTLADGHSLAHLLLSGAVLLDLTANRAVLLVNDRRVRDATPEPEQESQAQEPEGPRMPEEYGGPLPTQTEIELEFTVDPDTDGPAETEEPSDE